MSRHVLPRKDERREGKWVLPAKEAEKLEKQKKGPEEKEDL